MIHVIKEVYPPLTRLKDRWVLIVGMISMCVRGLPFRGPLSFSATSEALPARARISPWLPKSIELISGLLKLTDLRLRQIVVLRIKSSIRVDIILRGNNF